MIQKSLLLCLLFVSMSAQSYSFSELRYSHAIDRYIQLEGRISFYKNGLNIYYPQNKKELDYQDGTLRYFEDDKEVALSKMHRSYTQEYLNILHMVHTGEEEELRELFRVEEQGERELLYPLDSLKNYISYIELLRGVKKVESVKLFLKNSDTISIQIDGSLND